MPRVSRLRSRVAHSFSLSVSVAVLQDAIVKHRDPAFMKRHLSNPEGAGRNILSVLCCNYYMIKILAEPFLNTTRGVQDMVDNTAECVTVTRSRLSCTDFLSSANLSALPEEGDLEMGSLLSSPKRSRKHHNATFCQQATSYLTCLCAPCTNMSTPCCFAVIPNPCTTAG